MSRRERPDFKEFRRTDAESKTTPVAPMKIESVLNNAYADERASSVDSSRIGTFFRGFGGALTAFFQSAVSKTWGGCRSAVQWTWGGLKKIPSFCVIRWDSRDDTAVSDSTKKIEPAKPTVQSGGNAKIVPTDIDFDEDELAPSRWWNVGIKTAAAGIAVLILAGGYFAVKPLLSRTPSESAETTIETLERTEQTVSGVSRETAPLAANLPFVPAPEPIREPQWDVPAVVAAPPVSDSEPPKKDERTLPDELPPQGAPLADDPTFAQTAALAVTESTPTVTPAVAEPAPSVTNDPFAMSGEVPLPPTPAPADESTSTQNLASLQPLSLLDSAGSAQTIQPLPPLQPLVALDSAAVPSATVAATPTAAESSVAAPVAANFRERQAQRRANTNSSFSPTPVPPPVVSPIPQTTVSQTIPVSAPVKEIVPQIPSLGMVHHVPPPVVPPAPAVAEVPSGPSIYSNESVPAIPKDAPTAARAPVVSVPAAVPESLSSNLLMDSQPMDRQLWEQIRELRSDSEAEPTPKLQFGNALATAEPALRFTPRQAAPLANEEKTFPSEALDQFRDLLPTNDLRPNTTEFESAFSALENAPQPAFAEIRPAYREGPAEKEKGMTFQSRIDSEVKRSPTETEIYIVQPGDTYMTISDRYYGTSLLYTALAQHNQKLGIGWRLAGGDAIEIPTAEYLRTQYGEATHRQERLRDTVRPAVRYIVQEGDTIFRLATDKLHDSTRWREIYSMNSDRIQDVRDLKPGMEILLPPETARLNRQQTY